MLAFYRKNLFFNEENGYTVSSFEAVPEDAGQVPDNCRSSYSKTSPVFTAVGYNLPHSTNVSSKLRFEILGKWVKNPKYGNLQLEVETFQEIIPKTPDDIIAFLCSGFVKGIGEKTAKVIVKTLGVDCLEILDKDPEKFLQVKGISEKKLKKILQSYQENRAMREIYSFLQRYGVTPKKCVEIRRKFGPDAKQKFIDNPYCLCQVKGIGFKIADEIAKTANGDPASEMRIRGCILTVLDDCQSEGHLFLTKEDLRSRCHKMLNDGYQEEVCTERMIHHVVCLLYKEGVLKCDDQSSIYLPFNFNNEVSVAEAVKERLSHSDETYLFLKDRIDEEIDAAQVELGIILAEAQREAVKMVLINPTSIITGGPGTGKTTTLNVLLHVYEKLFPGNEIALAAPTGRAARRMEESTRHEAHTLHSLLGLRPDDNNDGESEAAESLDAKLVVVDEFSMVDMALCTKLMEAVPNDCKMVFVGDPDQLPSVGAGNVFKEFLDCGKIPTTRLQLVFRQGAGSLIASNANRIRENETFLDSGEEFELDRIANTETEKETLCVDKMMQHYIVAVNEYGVENVEILCPFRDRRESSAKAMNERIHDIVNPPAPDKLEIKHGKRTFRVGDRVIQMKNTDSVSNGDIGVVRNIGRDSEDDSLLVVIDFDGRVVEYTSEELDVVELAYAMTVHKSQGGEFKVVIMPMLSSYFWMLKRNLLYTGITRAKKKCVLVGEIKAINQAIHTNDIAKRNTNLALRINK